MPTKGKNVHPNPGVRIQAFPFHAGTSCSNDSYIALFAFAINADRSLLQTSSGVAFAFLPTFKARYPLGGFCKAQPFLYARRESLVRSLPLRTVASPS